MRRISTAEELRDLLTEWPPFAAQKIEVVEVADDWTHAVVHLGLEESNANYLGTAFGGSLFSMVDPFFVILAMQQLGPDYVVWDQSAEIDFLLPGRSTVSARIEVPVEAVAEMRAATSQGQKSLRWFDIDLIDEEGAVVARARRQLYVRKKRDC